jgi:hypothetical protein
MSLQIYKLLFTDFSEELIGSVFSIQAVLLSEKNKEKAYLPKDTELCHRRFDSLTNISVTTTKPAISYYTICT